MTINISNSIEVRRLIEDWGVFRDSGNWDGLQKLFHPNGVIRVAWYDGPARTFVELSKASAGRSFAKHIICNSSISSRDERAVAETNVILIGRGDVEGVTCHGETHMRFLDCLQQTPNGHWQIVERSTVYDHDLLFPISPNDAVKLSDASVVRWPIEYRFLALRLSARGLTVGDELPTRGSEAEQQIRLRSADWLSREQSS